MRRLLLATLLALLAGCSDDATGPPRVAELRIFQGVTQPVDTTLEVGTTVRLHVDLRGADGATISDRPVAWRSTAPGVAAVDTVGMVTALAPGTALVIAEADAASDTLRVQVVMPPDAFVACATTDPGLVLAVGQVHTVQANQATLLCLRGTDAGAEYALVPFHASTDAGQLSVEVATNGVTVAEGPPRPSVGVSAALSAGPLSPGLGDRFHRRLREWEGDNLGLLQGQRVPAGGARRSVATTAVSLSVGDTLHLNANADAACRDPDLRVAVVEAVTDRAIVLADTLNPAGGFTRAEYQQLGEDFDDIVWPVDTGNFGEPSDIDVNGKILIFFTKAVNDLTEPNSGSYIGGFFWGRDYTPKVDCAWSNAGEVFYMLVPDPVRGQQERPFSKDLVAEGTLGVIAHEFQHLISYSRRVANDAPVDEEVWLNEGLSHIAEELVFYHRSGLGPEQNLDVSDIRETEARRQAANRYMVSNLARFAEHLEHPETSSAIAGDDDLATRGAAWAFLRYVADRETGPGMQSDFWRTLVDSRRSGMDNLRDAIGEDPLPWLEDWSVSVYTDDAVAGVPARYTQPSWDFRSMLSALYEGAYPLGTIDLRAGEENATELSLQSGGAAYLRFGIEPGQRAAIRTTSGGATAPSRLRLSLVRTR